MPNQTIDARGIKGHIAIQQWIADAKDGDKLTLALPSSMLFAAAAKLAADVQERAAKSKKAITVEVVSL